MALGSLEERTTFQLCFDPREGDALVYRNIQAGVCGPFSETVPAADRLEAATWALGQGYMVAGEWTSHPNCDVVPLVRVGG